MNWKIIATHACLLLFVGIAAGFFEPVPDLNDPQRALVSYLLAESAIFLVSGGIFAHLAYRSSSRPLIHAVLAVLLSELVAFGLAALVPFDFPDTPLPLAIVGYTVSLVSLLVGTLVGARLRPMPNNSFSRRRFAARLNSGVMRQGKDHD